MAENGPAAKLGAQLAPIFDFFGLNDDTQDLFSKLLSLGTMNFDEADLELKVFRYLFNAYDADGSGSIDKSELRALFHDIGVIKGKAELINVSDEDLSDVLNELDEDESGKIEWNEFQLWVEENGFKDEFLK